MQSIVVPVKNNSNINNVDSLRRKLIVVSEMRSGGCEDGDGIDGGDGGGVDGCGGNDGGAGWDGSGNGRDCDAVW